MGEPGTLLGPESTAWGLKELVLTVGMALRISRPHVAMLMFICGARRNVLPGEGYDDDHQTTSTIRIFDVQSNILREGALLYLIVLIVKRQDNVKKKGIRIQGCPQFP